MSVKDDYAKLTPADHGIMAAALDDANRKGLGDDGTVDEVASALMEEGFTEKAANELAYYHWHIVMKHDPKRLHASLSEVAAFKDLTTDQRQRYLERRPDSKFARVRPRGKVASIQRKKSRHP